jgi:hypothetical protein
MSTQAATKPRAPRKGQTPGKARSRRFKVIVSAIFFGAIAIWIIVVVATSGHPAAGNAGYNWGVQHALDNPAPSCFGPATAYNASHEGNPSTLIGQFEAGCQQGLG